MRNLPTETKRQRSGLQVNGDALRSIRQLAGYNQVQLAEIVGIKQSFLSHVEAGRYNLSAAVAKRVAEALKVPVAAILLSGQS